MEGSGTYSGACRWRATNGDAVREGFFICRNGAEHEDGHFKVSESSSVIGILGSSCA
jgi:hypothetical protein